ncbi:MAG: metallophosphatase [Lachnospiraceae bacterium]|nr:metallophosphatase [Lachnospiraceae bacterium]
MNFIISGDTHGSLDIAKVVRFFDEHDGEYNEDDYLIICGDVAICGFDPNDESMTRATLQNLPVTTLFVDGNHENFEHLNSYPVDEWNGGKVHFVDNNIIHLMRGQVFEINGLKFFTFGGASSIDKDNHIPGITWFEEEIPTKEEMEEGWLNLQKNDFQVDYIITHTAPREVCAAINFGELTDEEIEVRRYFQRIADSTDFIAWYFGHFHVDEEVEGQFFCLFDEIIVIDTAKNH